MFNTNTMIKIIAIVMAFIFMISNQLLSAKTMSQQDNSLPTLVIDEDMGLSLPRNFRTTQDEYHATSEQVPSREGLANLKAAASAQFSKNSLEHALKRLDGPVWIVDLRKESHGFINGIPISWYSEGNQSNATESDDNVQRLEEMLFADLAKQSAIVAASIDEKKSGVIKKTSPIDLKVTNANTESSLINSLNLGYLRLGVSDHHKPDDSAVDQFIDFTKTLPPDAWLYFHCRAGMGRSTTFMVMYDILRNADKLSLDDIVKRQTLLGGTNIYEVSEDDEDAWKKEAAIERKNFIIKFYKYVKDSKGLTKTTWSEWSAKHH